MKPNYVVIYGTNFKSRHDQIGRARKKSHVDPFGTHKSALEHFEWLKNQGWHYVFVAEVLEWSELPDREPIPMGRLGRF